ncbi:glycosyltransferase family 2 protein [Novosphingobium sp. BL-8A]|uniref:glycosyltransferase family 2 protein n=1 Tax=Novosphingobium sp. BL-8A TaxID=3127639 RepID=UPI0037571FD0
MEQQEHALATASVVMAGWSLRPLFSVVVHEAEVPDATRLGEILSMLDRQSYPHWELIVVPAAGRLTIEPSAAVRMASVAAGNAAEALAIGVAEAKGEFILPLREDALLPPTALYRYAQALQGTPGAELFYGDHDWMDANGERIHPWFKPQWNEEMFLAQDYIAPTCVIRAEIARRAPPVDADLANIAVYALLLGLREGAHFVHVPHVQAHLRLDSPENGHQAERLLAVRRALADGVEVHPGPFGTLRVQWPLPTPPPLVSIIVPTRDHGKLLRACISGLLERTAYAPLEIIVVDNGSTESAALDYMRELEVRPEVRVLRYDYPYNYAALNNFAVAQARGEYLCLLNNDTEVTNGMWLAEMMRHAVRPQIGAVGAMLLYDDGSIQHAGVVVGLKQAAGHAHRFSRPELPGYFRYPHVPQYVSAVTAACLVLARHKYDAVGGLDEVQLAIAFNDVDLCLKLQQAGWRNLYAPQAVMLHHESKSRARDVSARRREQYAVELAILQQRWGADHYVDPLHHPQLDRDSEDFTIYAA